MGQPGATSAITILGTAQADTLVGSVFADKITTNGGGDLVTTGGGADTVNLGAKDVVQLWGFTGLGPLGDGSSIVDVKDAAHAGFWGVAAGAANTQIWGNGGASIFGNVTAAGITGGTSADMVTINGFTAGNGAGHNVLQFDVNQAGGPGDVSAWQHTFAFLNPLGGQQLGNIAASDNFIAAGDSNIFFSSNGATVNIPNATVIELQGNFANAAAVAAAIHTSSHFIMNSALGFIPNLDDMHILVAYQDQTGNTRIADLDLVNNSGGIAQDTAVLNVFVSDMAQLVGVAVNQVVNENIHFV